MIRCIHSLPDDSLFIRYSLRHGDASGANALRHWELQGSADGEHWVCLRAHQDDQTLAQRFQIGTWGVGSGGKAAAASSAPAAAGVHRWFRVLMTGPNSSRGWELRVAGFELYGEVLIAQPVDTMRAPLWYLRKWALDALVDAVLLLRASNKNQTKAWPASHSLARELETVGLVLGLENSKDLLAEVAAMAARDIAVELRVDALSAMCMLAPAATASVSTVPHTQAAVAAAAPQLRDMQTARGSPAVVPWEWTQAVLTCLEDSDGMVREAALVALEAFFPSQAEEQEGGERALYAGTRAGYDDVLSLLLPRVYHHCLRDGSGVGVGAAGGVGLASPIPGRRAVLGSGVKGGSLILTTKMGAGASMKASLIPAMPDRSWRPKPATPAPEREEAPGEPRGIGPRSVAQAVLEAMTILIGTSGAQLLRQILDAGARRPQSIKFGRRRAEAALPSLEDLIGQGRWVLRDALLEVLTANSERGDKEALATALEMLNDPLPRLRARAAFLVGQVSVRGEAGTTQRLMEAVGDKDAGVRDAASRSLSQVAADDARGQVRDLLALATVTGALPPFNPSQSAIHKSAEREDNSSQRCGPGGQSLSKMFGDHLRPDEELVAGTFVPGQRMRSHMAAASVFGASHGAAALGLESREGLSKIKEMQVPRLVFFTPSHSNTCADTHAHTHTHTHIHKHTHTHTHTHIQTYTRT